VFNNSRGINSHFMGVFTDPEIMREAALKEPELDHSNTHQVGPEMSFSEKYK
jgi:hypothetical protein